MLINQSEEPLAMENKEELKIVLNNILQLN